MDKITGSEPINSFSYETSEGTQLHTGISLRNYYAGLAMQGILANSPDWNETQINKDWVSKNSVAYADALIAELNK
jgi:hypothetical protein